jgi:hypothetical protein
MKIYLFLFTVATVLSPTLAVTLTQITAVFARIPWSVPNNDVARVTFPVNIANAPHEHAYRFSHAFGFQGQPGQPEAYITIGLLPQPDAGPGISVIRATFQSTFYADPDFPPHDEDNCNSHDFGVDWVVNCQGPYENTYHLEVRHTGGTTWNGTVINTVTNRRIHIGSITIPFYTGTVPTVRASFVELDDLEPQRPWPGCDQLPHSSVVLGVPMTNIGEGEWRGNPEEDACEDEDNFFNFQRTPDEIEINLGFPAEAATIRVQHEEQYAVGNCEYFMYYHYLHAYSQKSPREGVVVGS